MGEIYCNRVLSIIGNFEFAFDKFNYYDECIIMEFYSTLNCVPTNEILLFSVSKNIRTE